MRVPANRLDRGGREVEGCSEALRDVGVQPLLYENSNSASSTHSRVNAIVRRESKTIYPAVYVGKRESQADSATAPTADSSSQSHARLPVASAIGRQTDTTIPLPSTMGWESQWRMRTCTTHLPQMLFFAQGQCSQDQQRFHATPPRTALFMMQNQIVQQRHMEKLRTRAPIPKPSRRGQGGVGKYGCFFILPHR